MFEDWLDTLVKDKYEIYLPSLTIKQGGKPICTGSGQLSRTGKDLIRIQAASDGRDQLYSCFNGIFQPPGTLISRDTYISVEGFTQDGWCVSTNPVPFDGYHIDTGSPHVLWDFETYTLTLTRERTDRSTNREMRAILGPEPRTWVKPTSTEIRNEVFGTASQKTDWLTSKTCFGTVSARSRKNDQFELLVQFDSDDDTCNPYLTLNAIRRAFSFLLGKAVYSYGLEGFCGNQQTRRMDAFPKKITQNKLFDPLGNSLSYDANAENLLGKAIDFFLTEEGQVVGQHLFLCWDTLDNAGQTRMTLGSIVLEGLIKFAYEPNKSAKKSKEKKKDNDKELLREWLNTNKEQLSASFYNRVHGFLGTLDHRRPGDVLHEWMNRGLLNITKDDIDAWKEIRNPSAHGGMITVDDDRESLQTRWTKYTRVINLMNRIILQLMGYTGQYTDYAQNGWPAVTFPYAGPDALRQSEEVSKS